MFVFQKLKTILLRRNYSRICITTPKCFKSMYYDRSIVKLIFFLNLEWSNVIVLRPRSGSNVMYYDPSIVKLNLFLKFGEGRLNLYYDRSIVKLIFFKNLEWVDFMYYDPGAGRMSITLSNAKGYERIINL